MLNDKSEWVVSRRPSTIAHENCCEVEIRDCGLLAIKAMGLLGAAQSACCWLLSTVGTALNLLVPDLSSPTIYLSCR